MSYIVEVDTGSSTRYYSDGKMVDGRDDAEELSKSKAETTRDNLDVFVPTGVDVEVVEA